MATQTNTQADELAKFKTKFTQATIDEYFGGTQQAIAFFEMQLLVMKTNHKELNKRIAKNSVFDSFVTRTAQSVPALSTITKKFEQELISAINTSMEILQGKIDYLKTLKTK